MKRLYSVIASMLLATQAGASSLFLDNGSSASLGAGDVIDNVVLIESASVTLNVGADIGSVTLLDFSVATFNGVTGLATVEVYDDSTANVVGSAYQVDGNPVPTPTVLTSLLCPSCALTGTLIDGDPLNVTLKVAQSGEVNLVPEPMASALFGLGLMGLSMLPTRKRSS